MNYPKATQEIFELLSRGHFLCDNSPHRNERKLYDSCEEDLLAYRDYFAQIGFGLEEGDGYFYFSKTLNNKSIDEKLQKVLDYIDLVELMLQYSPTFGVGFRTTVAEFSIAVKGNAVLKDRLERLHTRTANATLHQQCAKVLDTFVKGGFMSVENEHEQRYRVLSSYDYLETFLSSIEVPDFE
jgi:hypothetical protein